jgi:hypothetical protein
MCINTNISLDETCLVRGDYIGKDLTVQFFELTDDGVPRFPVGIAVRDYE